MKILIVNWQDIKNPLAGGAEVHLHEVFSRIARQGHRITLYCSSFPGALAQEEINGITVIRRGGRYLFNFRFPSAYRIRFKNEAYDIVVDDMNKIPFFTPLYVKEPIYGVTHHLFGASIFKEVNFILASYVYLMEKLAVWFYRRKRIPFIVGSPSTERELLAHGFRPEEISIINYAVDHETHGLSQLPKSATPSIGYFGRLKRYKSVDHLLHALPEVLARVPDMKLLIVGEGDDRPRLQSLAGALGIQHHVEFTGFVPEERKVELLRKIWFKVTTSSKEGWGLTVIEANACGTPVVASNVQGLRDAVKDNETGLLYTYGEIHELAEKIVLLATNRELRDRLATNAVAWSKTFNWDAAAANTLTLLKKRVKAAPPSGA